MVFMFWGWKSRRGTKNLTILKGKWPPAILGLGIPTLSYIYIHLSSHVLWNDLNIGPLHISTFIYTSTWTFTYVHFFNLTYSYICTYLERRALWSPAPWKCEICIFFARNPKKRSTKIYQVDLRLRLVKWNWCFLTFFFLFREGVKGQSRAPGVFSWKLYSEFFWERTMRKQWCSFFHHFRMRKHWKVEYQSGATDDGWDHLCSLRFNASIRSQWLLIFGSYPVRVTRHVLLNEKKHHEEIIPWNEQKHGKTEETPHFGVQKHPPITGCPFPCPPLLGLREWYRTI